MITRDEKRMAAMALAVMTCFATVLLPGVDVRADDSVPAVECATDDSQSLQQETTSMTENMQQTTDELQTNQELKESDADVQDGTLQALDVTSQANTAESAQEEDTELAQSGAAGTENGYEYAVLSDGTISITGYSGTDTNIVIPDTISGKKVSEIGEYAFLKNDKIENVTVPKSVTSLQYGSFNTCANLKNITFAAGSELQKVDNLAFENDKKLEKFECPQNVKSIGRMAFYDCENLSEVKLNDKLESIGDYAFSYSGVKSVDIKDSITSLGAGAFDSCKQLQSVKIGKGIKNIKYYTFAWCEKLDKVIIPDNITNIGAEAFYKCGLTSIIIPDSVTSILDNK